MDESILNSIKRALGLAEGYDPFDFEITMHINSVLATLKQLGVGPHEGLLLDGAETTWNDLLDDDKSLMNVMSYIFLKVRMLFDIPQTAHLVGAYEKQIEELEWRLRVAADPYVPQMTLYSDDDEFGDGPIINGPIIIRGGKP